MNLDNEQPPSTAPDKEDLDVQEILSRPSSFREIGATMRGFATEQDARAIGNTILGFLRLFGTFLDLERLDAVTVAFDYDQALTEVERGFPAKLKLLKTQDEFALGVAMAPMVMRDGKPFAHMVINAAVVYSLKEHLDSPDSKLAVHVLAHEAAHVHDLAMQDRAFPGLYGSALTDYRDATLFSIAHWCWNEYIASRLSASFGTPNLTTDFESTFCSALETTHDRGNAAILAYRTHHDIERLVSELVAIYGKLLVYGAYLLGHVDGLDRTMQEAATKAHSLVQQTSYFQSRFERFESELRKAHNTYGQWNSIEVVDGIKAIAEEMLNTAGISFEKQPNGTYWVDVPFTAETMPTWRLPDSPLQ